MDLNLAGEISPILAEILGLSTDATKQRLHRGRALLRRELTGSSS